MNVTVRDIAGFLVASRVPNLLIIAYTQIATVHFLLEKDSSEWMRLDFILLLISTAMIGAGGYIINDYFDQKIDMINRPNQVVVGLNLRRRLAIFFHLVLSIGGILIGFWIDPFIGLVHVFSTGALWTYSGFIKRVLLLSTLTISFLTILTILIVMVFFRELNLLAMVYALFGCAIIFIRETIKDIISAKGERVFGINSVPIVWGIRGAKVIIYLVCGAAISLLFVYLLTIQNWSVRLFFIGLVPFIVWFIYRLIIADKISDFRYLKLFVDLIIVSGLVSIVLV